MPKTMCIDLIEDNGFVYTIESSPEDVDSWLDIIEATRLSCGVTVRRRDM